MSEAVADRGLSRRLAERVVATVLVLLAGATLWDSIDRGAGWASDGPRAGYFPARVGALMLVGAGIALWSSLKPGRDEVFVTYVQLRRVMQVFGPLVIYVALIQPLGIYLASGLFMAGMMLLMGPFRVWQVALTAVVTPLLFFVVFERWFAVPLPKGPIEAMLGY